MTDEERGAAGIASLPEDLAEAIDLAEGSELLRRRSATTSSST